MENVQLEGIYRGILLTADLTTLPNEAAWPDDDIIAADLTATISGAPFGGAKTITKSAVLGETGKHTITINCAGVAAGSVIELSGEYYIDSVRYSFFAEIYVDASPLIHRMTTGDQFIIDDGGKKKLEITDAGLTSRVIPLKTIKQLNGADLTDFTTQGIGGYVEE